MMKKNQVKLKQAWRAKIVFNVLYHSTDKDSNIHLFPLQLEMKK